MSALKDIKDSLDAGLLAFFDDCLARLTLKLLSARAELESIIESDSGNLTLGDLTINLKRTSKLRYARLEKHLQKTLDDLESWHTVFDPSWLLITRPPVHSIDHALSHRSYTNAASPEVDVVRAIRNILHGHESNGNSHSTIFRDPSIVSDDRQEVACSNITLAHLSDTSAPVLLDATRYPLEAESSSVVAAVRDLGRILSKAEPSSLGLLQCLGVIKENDPHGSSLRFQFVYGIPPSLTNPVSLRALLLLTPRSLDVKFRLAKAIARGVTAVHAVGFVHKNIRPETVLVFEEQDNPLPVSFLVGFERTRAVAAVSFRAGDMVWQRNLYRHPMRQGIRPESDYTMQHDIFSLGVCLLELGLWTSFVSPGDNPQPGPLLHIDGELGMSNKREAALRIKTKLVEIATNQLPEKMGMNFTEVVISCLTCLDPGATNMFAAAADLFDDDGILVGVAFIEKILLKLEAISI